MAQPYRNVGSIESTGALASATDQTGIAMDYDAGNGYAQITAKASGVGGSLGLRLRAVVGGVATSLLSFAAGSVNAVFAGAIAATTLALVASSPGPVATVNNGANPSYIEFSKTGYAAKGSVGTLGSIEMNLAFNMNYATGIHKYYDSTSNAFWYALNPNGVYLQYAPSGLDNSGTNDIWTEGGNLYNWYSLANGNMYARGNGGFGDFPVSSARLYAKGTTTDNSALGLYSTDSAGVENFKQWNDGTLYNKGNTGIGASPLSTVRLFVKGATTDGSTYLLYAVDSAVAEKFVVKTNGAVAFNGATPQTRGNITGSRGSNAALTSLISFLAARGDITDSTT